jgi:hypothetical protein
MSGHKSEKENSKYLNIGKLQSLLQLITARIVSVINAYAIIRTMKANCQKVGNLLSSEITTNMIGVN